MSKAGILETGMPKDRERRSGQRLVTRLPVEVRNRSGSTEVTAYTRDVSTSGVFLYCESKMPVGSEIELVLILPPELVSGEKCWVCCHARVLRVEEGLKEGFGVAAEIRRMQILPEIPV